jgi:curved DNA-binding protein CbpA
MEEDLNHYKTLGIEPTATANEIVRAFRRLSKAYHPDTGASDETMMRKVNEAKETLTDPSRHAAYDATLAWGRIAPPEQTRQRPPRTETPRAQDTRKSPGSVPPRHRDFDYPGGTEADPKRPSAPPRANVHVDGLWWVSLLKNRSLPFLTLLIASFWFGDHFLARIASSRAGLSPISQLGHDVTLASELAFIPWIVVPKMKVNDFVASVWRCVSKSLHLRTATSPNDAETPKRRATENSAKK